MHIEKGGTKNVNMCSKNLAILHKELVSSLDMIIEGAKSVSPQVVVS